ncbi:MAG: hypothetical protein R3B45_14900 [Bdellovibrionota bacterium]
MHFTLSGFACGAILLFSFMHLLPEIFGNRDFIALFVFCLGFSFPFCPGALGKVFSKQRQDFLMGLLLLLTGLGFAFHVFIEGTAIAAHENTMDIHLGMAVIVHRFTVSLLLFRYLVYTQKHYALAVIVFIALITGTTAGYFWGQSLVTKFSPSAAVMSEAFVAGTLLHFLFRENQVTSGVYRLLFSSKLSKLGFIRSQTADIHCQSSKTHSRTNCKDSPSSEVDTPLDSVRLEGSFYYFTIGLVLAFVLTLFDA